MDYNPWFYRSFISADEEKHWEMRSNHKKMRYKYYDYDYDYECNHHEEEFMDLFGR